MNPWLATLRDIAGGLRAQPGRTGLALLAIAIGMAALTVLLAVLGGLADRARQLTRELGVNVFLATAAPDAVGTATARRLERRHAEGLAANLPGCSVSGLATYTAPGAAEGPGFQILAADEHLLETRPWQLVAGRFLDPRDLKTAAHHAVVSQALCTERRWRLGDTVLVRDLALTIVGIVATGQSSADLAAAAPAAGWDTRIAMIPATLPPPGTGGSRGFRRGLDAIFIKARDAANYGHALAAAQRLMAQPDWRAPPIAWVTPEALVQPVRRMQALIRWTIGSIAGLCLVLGGATLMSLMLANVRDRVAEIGLRRSLGARPRDIALLFVAEAAVITLAAALGGTLAAVMLLRAAAPRMPVALHLTPGHVLLAWCLALVCGMAFSFWPARAAARITPADALRNE